MAKTIGQLPAATTVGGSDELIIQQSGVTKKATKTQVLAGIVNANVDAAAAIAGTKIAPNFGSQDIEANGNMTISKTSGIVALNVAMVTNSAVNAGIVAMDRPGTSGGATPSNITIGEVRFTGRDTGSTYMAPAMIHAGIGTNASGGAPGFLAFSTAPSGAGTTERMRIDASGNVGIGTSSPQGALHVVRSSAGGIRVSGEQNDYTGIQIINASGCEAQFHANGNAGVDLRAVTNHPLSILTNNTERIRVEASGNVGIGTSGPNAAALVDVTSTTQGFLPPRMTNDQRNAISTPPAGLMIYNTTTNKLNVRVASSWEAVTSS